MQPYLILPKRHTVDDAAIWLAAVKRGLKTHRTHLRDGIIDDLPADADKNSLYYYGNTLQILESKGLFATVRLDPLWVYEVNQLYIFGRLIDVDSFKNLKYYNVNKKLFVKCVHEKWFTPTICFPKDLISEASKPDDLVHIQDVVEFTQEVRCFCLNGEIVTYSYYRKNGQLWSAGITDTPPLPRWEWLVKEASKALPDSIVIDVGLIGSEWYVIEANEPWASGLYDCDPDKVLEVILAGQTENR